MTTNPAAPTPTEKALSAVGLPLALLITAAGIVVAVIGGDLVSRLKIIAMSAAALGAISAGLTLWAHKGSDEIDGFAKMLGFSAAMLAVTAAFVLLKVELIIAAS